MPVTQLLAKQLTSIDYSNALSSLNLPRSTTVMFLSTEIFPHAAQTPEIFDTNSVDIVRIRGVLNRKSTEVCRSCDGTRCDNARTSSGTARIQMRRLGISPREPGCVLSDASRFTLASQSSYIIAIQKCTRSWLEESVIMVPKVRFVLQDQMLI